LKKYVFLTFSIANLGGQEMYVRSKLLYLKKNGWEVNIFSINKGEIYIHDFDSYTKQIIPKLGTPTYLTLKHDKKKVIRVLLDSIRNEVFEELVIESHSIFFATWGELLAKELNCKHIVYSLIEENQLKDKELLEFAEFKHKRKELAGITRNYVHDMLHSYREISLRESYHLVAYSSDIVEDYAHPILRSIPKGDYTIGNIGRLGKTYLLPVLDDIILYINKKFPAIFNVIIIGGDPELIKIQRKIRLKFKQVPNANLVMTGYIYPIPKKLITLADVFISVSGSAVISEKLGVPTISIDVNDFKPIGVLGFTTKNIIFRDREPVIPLGVLLDEVLISKYYKKEIIDLSNCSIPDFSSHMKFILESEQSKEYYDINTKIPFRILMKFKDVIKNLICFFLGKNEFKRLKAKYSNI